MEKNYKTAEIAKMFGIHPNTVRLYEEYELIPKPERLANGYRRFTDFHIAQIRLARTAMQVEVLQNGLRRKMIEVIKLSAVREFEKAIHCTKDYLSQIAAEQADAEEAIAITGELLSGTSTKAGQDLSLTRKQAADYLHITIDTLRNWELNGLLYVSRKQNGYRIYDADDIRILKIIRSLRCANYSLAAILRMIHAVSQDIGTDIRQVIDTPAPEEDIVTACDKLLTSLNKASDNAKDILSQLEDMKGLYAE